MSTNIESKIPQLDIISADERYGCIIRSNDPLRIQEAIELANRILSQVSNENPNSPDVDIWSDRLTEAISLSHKV